MVNEVGDDAAARQQVTGRTADSAFVVAPTGEMKIYVAGGGGRSVATAAEAVGREIATRGGFAATVEDVAPTSPADPSGTSVLRRHIPFDRSIVGRDRFWLHHGQGA